MFQKQCPCNTSMWLSSACKLRQSLQGLPKKASQYFWRPRNCLVEVLRPTRALIFFITWTSEISSCFFQLIFPKLQQQHISTKFAKHSVKPALSDAFFCWQTLYVIHKINLSGLGLKLEFPHAIALNPGHLNILWSSL